MCMMQAIEKRRSVRKYKAQQVPRELIETVLHAGMLAPSAKNRQPWRFVVVTEREKASMLRAMAEGLQKEEDGDGLLEGSKRHMAGARYTMEIMEEAPVTVFVLNKSKASPLEPLAGEARLYEMANLQSIGAAMENMTLAATELGLGSLWICDVFFAYRELCDWLGTEYQMAGAMSFGYPAQEPSARPRKSMERLVQWR